MVEEYDYLFKTIVVGDGGVGKTALTIRFSKDFFTEDYKMTIGVDFHVKTITIDSSEGDLRCKLQIWDTGGQERFSSIRPMYYRGSLGALVIYDLTNYESFEHLPQWIEEIRANIKNEIPLLLVGNKSDLTEQRAVSMEEINDFTKKFNLHYMETSAKTGDGVGDCFHILACLMIGSGVPDKLISDGIVYSPGNIITPLKGTTEPEFELSAPPVLETSAKIIPEPAPSIELEPEYELSAPPIPETSIKIIPEPAQTFELEPEIDFAAPPVPEPQPKQAIDPAPIFEPEPEIKFDAPPVPEPIKEEEQKPTLTSLPKPQPSVDSETYKPKTVPFSPNAPVPAPAPEGFQFPKVSETTSGASKKAKPFIPTTPSQPSSSDSLFDYLPEPTLSKKELKELEKQKKLEEKERKAQEEKAAKEAARLEKERKIQEAKEAKEAIRLEKERKIQEEKAAKEAAKLEKEKKIQEAKEAARLEKERKAQEEKAAKEAKKSEKKKKSKEEPGPPDMFQVSFPPSKTTEESSLFQALTQKPGETSKSSLFTPFSPSEKSESSKLRIIPNVADLENFSNPLPPIPTVQDKSSKRRETIVCKQCGAVLSSDYAFCNKCGSAL